MAALQDGEGEKHGTHQQNKSRNIRRSENEAIARNIAAVFHHSFGSTMEEMTEDQDGGIRSGEQCHAARI